MRKNFGKAVLGLCVAGMLVTGCGGKDRNIEKQPGVRESLSVEESSDAKQEESTTAKEEETTSEKEEESSTAKQEESSATTQEETTTAKQDELIKALENNPPDKYEGESYRITEKCYDNAGKLSSAGVEVFDEYGEVVGREIYSVEDELCMLTKWCQFENEYNEQGKMIRQRTYCIGFGVPPIGMLEYEYDEKGNLIKKIEIEDYQGEVELLKIEYIYEYDNKSQLIKMSESNYNMGVFVSGDVIEYVYDDNGHMISEIVSIVNEKKEATLVKKLVYKYNEKGLLIKKTNEVSGGEVEYTHKYKYNNKGIISKATEYKYDDKGNMIEEKDYTEKGNVVCREYDEYGNEIKEKIYTAEGKLGSLSVYEYNEHNDMIRIECYGASNESHPDLYTVNLDEANLGEADSVQCMTYKYDSLGRVLERTFDYGDTMLSGDKFTYEYSN